MTLEIKKNIYFGVKLVNGHPTFPFSADINHINFETLAKDLKFVYLFSILYKLSCLASSSFGHSKRKCISSSTVNLHSLQIN
jgi:hypothetical protein